MIYRLVCVVLVSLVICGCKKQEMPYSSSPLFSESGFATVRSGMSEDDVRELLGNPVGRFGPVTSSQDSRVDWEYSVPQDALEPIEFRQFLVSFGEDHLVQRKQEVLTTWEPDDGVEERIAAVQTCRREIGDIVFTSVNGSTQELLASDGGLHIILLDSDCRAGSCRLNPGAKWFQEALPDLLETNRIVSVKHFYVGKKPDVYRKLVASLAPEASQDCFLEAEPDLKLSVIDLDSQMLLYQEGVLWSVTPADGFPNGDLGAEDQEWMIRRLAEGGGGGEI